MEKTVATTGGFNKKRHKRPHQDVKTQYEHKRMDQESIGNEPDESEHDQIYGQVSAVLESASAHEFFFRVKILQELKNDPSDRHPAQTKPYRAKRQNPPVGISGETEVIYCF